MDNTSLRYFCVVTEFGGLWSAVFIFFHRLPHITPVPATMITRQQHDSGVEKCLGWPLDGRVGMVPCHLYSRRISLPARVWERHVAEERVQRRLVAILAADVVG